MGRAAGQLGGQMNADASQSGSPRRSAPPVFPIACWGLGLVAFSQLLVAGLALAERFESSQVVRVVEKEVTKLVPIRVPVPAAAAPVETAGNAVEARPPVVASDARAVASLPTMPAPTPVMVPGIADAQTERLITEARRARIGGDMGMAIVKLEEARKLSPDEPHVFYELGLVHEAMGVFDMASEHYQKVFEMGINGAGSLYEDAAAKLRDGFAQPGDLLGKLSLERVQIFKDPEHEAGKRVVLTVPVEKAPGETIDPSQVLLTVAFFNRNTRGEITQLEDQTWAAERWLHEPVDWADGKESLRVEYVIPRQDGPTEHLFGDLDYYGQVVTLHYGEEVLDVQAWPRDLAARMNRPAPAGDDGMQFPEFLDPNMLPPDFDPNLPLLPPR